MKTARRFDLLEVGLIAWALCLITMVLTLRSFSGLDAEKPYRDRFGKKVSQGPEEWIVRDFFDDARGGVFVDVGASDHRDNSNTWRLETYLGWSGVAIDAQAQYADGYRTNRPRTLFVPVFVSDRPDGEVDFFVPVHNPGVASSDQAYVAAVDRIARTDRVPTRTLTQILDQAGIKRIDYMSMDIERAEPKALAGFDVARFRPRLVCIEGHVPVRQAILNYFADHKYVVVGKYWNVDTTNLYFMPRPEEQATVRR